MIARMKHMSIIPSQLSFTFGLNKWCPQTAKNFQERGYVPPVHNVLMPVFSCCYLDKWLRRPGSQSDRHRRSALQRWYIVPRGYSCRCALRIHRYLQPRTQR